MDVRLSPSEWRKARVDENMDYVRAALYLGYSILEIASVVSDPSQADERAAVLLAATRLGMTDKDTVSLDPRARP